MLVEFIESYDVSKLTPADYNPRYISPDKIEKLKCSIRDLGMIKPVIVNGNVGILTAGHQRTCAMTSLGLTHCPVLKINKEISKQDEIRFNLFHNSIETNKSIVSFNLESYNCHENTYITVKNKDIVVSENNNPQIVKNICNLIYRYGGWGSVICDIDGNVIDNSDYAVSAKFSGVDVVCYVLSKEKIRLMREYFAEDYGEYYYEKLGVKSYNQLYCQPNRLSKSARQTLLRSDLYHSLVIDKVPKSYRILDFGAGRCAYVNYLRTRGYHIFAYEPNFQSNRNLDVGMVVKMINDIYNDVCVNGLFDIVITDSVLNSVVNAEVERIVLTACNTFLKKTGTMLIATRSLERLDGIYNAKKATDTRRDIEFLDKNNFSATFRDGVWTMQHFHSTETLKELLDDFFDDAITYLNTRAKTVMAVCHMPKVIPEDKVAEALEFELNMEYPNNYHHNKHLNLKSKLIELVKERNHEIQT